MAQVDNFIVWLPQNMHVYREFERRTMLRIDRGQMHIGAKDIAEDVRFKSPVAEKTILGDPKFKLNNNYTAYLPRVFMRCHPQYANRFELRAVERPEALEQVMYLFEKKRPVFIPLFF